MYFIQSPEIFNFIFMHFFYIYVYVYNVNFTASQIFHPWIADINTTDQIFAMTNIREKGSLSVYRCVKYIL